jgi:transcriptional regulator with XRE-family HTH domain
MSIPTAAEYMDQVIERSMSSGRAIRYDNDIAEATGVTRQTLTRYRAGKTMSVIAAVKFAKLLNIHQMEVVAASMYHQSKTEEDRKLWEETYEEYRKKGAE